MDTSKEKLCRRNTNYIISCKCLLNINPTIKCNKQSVCWDGNYLLLINSLHAKTCSSVFNFVNVGHLMRPIIISCLTFLFTRELLCTVYIIAINII